MKQLLFFLSISALLITTTKASHIVGGEIYWKCIKGTGEYVFYTTFYRDCGPNTASYPTNPITISVLNTPRPNNNTLSAITLNYVTPPPGTPIGPNGGAGVGTNCQSCAVQYDPISCGAAGGDYGSIEKYVFRSNPIRLDGKPPSGNANQWVNGWVFVFTTPCCRSSSIENIVSKNGAILKAIMYGDGRNSQDPCYDSSPEFMADPSTLVCEGYDFHFSNVTQDEERDSLSFSFENVMDGSGSGSNFSPQFNAWASGFALNAPTPTSAMNPLNKTATVNSNTGEIRMTAYLPATIPVNRAGIYVVSNRVDAYSTNTLGQRVKTASVFRDMPFNVFRCPKIQFTYNNNGTQVSINERNQPPFTAINNNITTSFDTTIYAGDSLSFNFAALDSNFSPCSLTNLTTVSLEAFGSQFDTSFSNPLGNCLIKPCATLNPAPTGNPLKRLSGVAQIGTAFNWQTSCNHIDTTGGAGKAVLYTFTFRVQDDFCPVPSFNDFLINVKVLPNPKPTSPEVFCIDTMNKKYTLHFGYLENLGNSFQYINLYIGQRPVGSNQAFVSSGLPYDTINYSSGNFEIPNLLSDPSIEYGFQLETVFGDCFNSIVQKSPKSPFYSINNLNSAVLPIFQNGNILSVNQTNADGYQWYRNGVILPNDTLYYLSVNDNATYNAILQFGNCNLQTVLFQPILTSLSNNNISDDGLTIFPNPTNGILNIKLQDNSEKIQNVIIYGLDGKQLQRFNNSKAINLQNLENSLYFIRVETDKNVYLKKIIKK